MRYTVYLWLAIPILCLHLIVNIQSDVKPASLKVRDRQRSVPSPARPTNQTLTGFYFGISENQLGKRGWLFNLDSNIGRGKLYMPPANPELVEVKLSQTGRLTFRSFKDVGDVVYLFDGVVSPSGIAGQLQIAREDNEKHPESAALQVVLTKLDLSSAAVSTPSISGLYSNVQYSPEGGDLTGAELILFRHEGKLIVIFTSYENDMLPYLGIGMMQSRNRINFSVRTPTGEERYSAVISRRRIDLRRIDGKADPHASQLSLTKRRELANIFTAKRLAEK